MQRAADISMPLVGALVIHHVAVAGDADVRRRQVDDILVDRTLGTAEAVIDDHDLAAVAEAARAAHEAAVIETRRDAA